MRGYVIELKFTSFMLFWIQNVLDTEQFDNIPDQVIFRNMNQFKGAIWHQRIVLGYDFLQIIL